MALLLALVQQQRLHKPRVFRDRTQPLDCMDDDELISRYRMPRMCITELCDLLATELQRTTARSCALPVSTQVLVALRFYATGSMQCVAGDLHGISQPSEDAVSLSTQHWWLPAVSARTLCTDHHCMCRVAQHVYQQRSSHSRRAQPVTHQW